MTAILQFSESRFISILGFQRDSSLLSLRLCRGGRAFIGNMLLGSIVKSTTSKVYSSIKKSIIGLVFLI
jgi:hypothetical protein